MNGSDADMVEAVTTVSTSDANEVVRNLLTQARQLVDHGKPSQALQAVVMAMKVKGGDEAVLQALNRARELYISKIQTSAAADELASLFAECAIVEAMPSLPPQPIQPIQHNNMDLQTQSTEPDSQGTSILAQTGRNQVVLDAFADGSSFVCLQCGGLVSNHRKDEHLAFWCCKI